MKYLIFYLSVISIISIIITIYDKIASKHHKRRIPEKTLMILGALGGAEAMYIVMQIIRHKTKHKKFMIGLPFEIFIHILLIFVLFYQNHIVF